MQQEDTILVPEITTFCRSRGFWTTFNFELERPYWMRKFREFSMASMGHKHVSETIDRTMEDIRKKSSSFAGLTVLLAGDWRQILPVVRHRSRPDIVDATLKSSYLWQIVTRLQLIQNMRAKLRGESSQFVNFLLSIGDGKEKHHKDKGHFFIKLPDDITVENEK